MPQGSSRETSGIRVVTEAESAHGWRFVIAAPRRAADSSAAEHEMTLAWVDYEFWSHGMHSPSRVAEAVVGAVIAAQPERELPARFDASTARRWVSGLDALVRERL
jgi:hypothetical protein